MSATTEQMHTVKCQRCEQSVWGGNRRRYCVDCQEAVRQEQKAANQRKKAKGAR